MVVLSRNTINSAMYMIVSFAGAAGLFMILEAFFLGILQVLVYAGAVMVLFLFIIMLLNVEKAEQHRLDKGSLIISVLCLIILSYGFYYVIQSTPELGQLRMDAVPGMPSEHAPFGFTTSAKSFGYGLFTKYMLPIQVTGFLLLLAMVGVVVISKKYEEQDVHQKRENSR